MELILWRHAEAEPGEPDAERALTAKGHKQAAKMAEWLDSTLPSGCRILVSPTLRTRQTAEALERKFKLCAELAPDASVKGILAAANWPQGREPVLIIGHQPSLGRLAALLVSGTEQDWPIRKGSVWWFAQRIRTEQPQTYVRAVMAPELVLK
ncbi:phosphohistidine phosphatase SixA [Herminiimonas sp. CN]|uniref:phosphohistidine phosphatase SixA n=1 Tax=Herminiimonas sp. CN TaxID=1349818 RepID=UPI000473E8D8|nr:phosphohistidine phosphatase SixA [Herminiimonas sp. CN]